MEYKFNVAMTCQGCVKAVERVLSKSDLVSSFTVSLPESTVVVLAKENVSIYYAIGPFKPMPCSHLVWLSGDLILQEWLEKSSYYYKLNGPNPIVSAVNGKIAVANGKCITILGDTRTEILTKSIVKGLFYSKSAKLVSVEQDVLEIFNFKCKLYSIPIQNSGIINVDFNEAEDCFIIISSQNIQKYRLPFEIFYKVQTLQLDSLLLHSRFVGGIWARSRSNNIHALTDSGILMVIKDNLWVDRTVDVKMDSVKFIIGVGGVVVVGGSFARIFELDTLSYKHTLKKKSRLDYTSCHIVSDTVIALVYSNYDVDFWDLEDLSSLKLIKRKFSISILDISSGTDSLITLSRDGTLNLWDLDNQSNLEFRKKIVIDSVHGLERSIVLASSGIHGLVAIGDDQGLIKLYNVLDLEEQGSSFLHCSSIQKLEFSDSLKKCFLVSICKNFTINVFEIDNGLKLKQTIKEDQSSIHSIIVCQEGHTLVAAAHDCIIIRKLNQNDLFEVFLRLECTDFVCDIGYDGGCDQLLSVSENRKISFFSLKDGEKLELQSWDIIGNSILFSKVNVNSFKSMAAIACSDNSILLVDLITGRKLERFFGHSQKIVGLEFAKDGRNILFSSAKDGVLIAWKFKESYNIPRSSSENVLNLGSVDLPSGCFPAWVRKHSKSDIPTRNRHVIPQGRWAQRISMEGIRLHSDTDLKAPLVASFLDGNKKRLSAEISELTVDDCSNENENPELLRFHIVQREKWEISKNIKLINQSEKCAPSSPNEAKGGSNIVLDSLDLAGMTGIKGVEGSSDLIHIRSKSDFSGIKTEENNDDRVEALGIIIKKGETNNVMESPSINIGEVEDDDEIQDELEIGYGTENIKIKDDILPERNHVRHATLGFVESMVEQLETLRSSDSQNTTKIAEIEYELSKIGEIVRGALKNNL